MSGPLPTRSTTDPITWTLKALAGLAVAVLVALVVITLLFGAFSAPVPG